jgi:YjjG family noncanonical pyrimidine nucleotidase
MKKYELLLIDIDDTLLDFHADARKALKRTWESLSLPVKPELYSMYEDYNAKLWRRLELGEIGIEDIKKERFRQLIEDTGLSVDPLIMNQLYEERLSQEATLMEEVHETMRYLKSKYILIGASNGIARVQKGRLEASSLREYFAHSILSEDIGVSKPDADFFNLGLRDYPEVAKEKMLMIGDSLTSDILGANNYGVDACWINREKKERPADLSVLFEVRFFFEIREFL